ncbi:MAG: hypothetical protein IT223_08765 [Crocinitomicaceae bacterium]|nr:hypothetical protein [Crocinitomicaceae bacterium]
MSGSKYGTSIFFPSSPLPFLSFLTVNSTEEFQLQVMQKGRLLIAGILFLSIIVSGLKIVILFC